MEHLHLELHCTVIIEAWLKINMHYDSTSYLELLNARTVKVVYILLNVKKRNRISISFNCFFLGIASCVLAGGKITPGRRQSKSS